MNVRQALRDIRAKAKEYRGEQLALLGRLVSVDSGTGNAAGNLRVVEILEGALEGVARVVERREVSGVGTHLIARVGQIGAGRKVLCLAHLDTVFESGQAKEFPFRVEDDTVYGLGVVDCKAGVAVSLYAIKIAGELGLIPGDLEIALIYDCDEETGSETARGLIASEAKDAQAAFVFEPSPGREGFVSHAGGSVFGSVSVESQVMALAAGGAGNRDATLAIARITASLESHNDPSRGIFFHVFPRAPKPDWALAKGMAGRRMAGEGQEGAGGGEARELEGRAGVEFLATFRDGVGLKYVNDTLDKLGASAWAPGCRITLEREARVPTEARRAGTLKAAALAKTAGAKLGLALAEEGPTSLSDGSWCSFYGLPTLDSLGPSARDIHTEREAMSLKNFYERTELFAMIVALLEKEFFRG
ncbi:MAG: M20/M25/M40 family metallo-hydrolase [Deltaproteobacteria bacterium]|jgi:glutamate carboxypeptidase|nr:M20/M25/M40 family metallo-hydrolase [Deltaproteobacteria bacterium]